MDSVFQTLNAINVNEHTEKKNGLTYLSWAWCWTEVKKAYPEATYKIYENENGWNYFSDGKTCWVKTGVKIGDIENIEYLPIMDFRNNSIALEKVTSTDVNKAIQRSLTKACARHGLGLYIYAGEDLPEGDEPTEKEPKEEAKKPAPQKTKKASEQEARMDEAQARTRVLAYVNSSGMSAEAVNKLCALYKVDSLQNMSPQQCAHYINYVLKNGGKI